MRYLILSDIHSNFEALESALEAAAGSYDTIICCGDIVGYGPDPNAVTDWVRAHVAITIRGNHDRAAVGLENLEWFNPVARDAAIWTKRELTPENGGYLRGLARGPMLVDSFVIAHGSPLDEDGYVISPTDAAYTFPYLERELTFFGHTHLQGGFVWSRLRVRPIPKPTAQHADSTFQIEPDEAYLANPGSVGQPRDGDPRAAFLIYDTSTRCLHYHRVPYDIAAVQKKIRHARLPDVLADRLSVGR
ncbi:MAG: metallophosphoesterase family protein [Bryobacteraceae bacterium]